MVKRSTKDRKTLDDKVATIQAVVDRISPLLAGLGQDVQGAILADLVAIWLAGIRGEHKGEARAEALTDWLQTMGDLIPINEMERTPPTKQ